MDQRTFENLLRDEGYQQPVIVEREPNGRLGRHTHPFEAKALILNGWIAIETEGQTRVYQAGDTFHLAAEEAHSESYGPDGVRYLAGRR
ncbi:MAG: cupin [Zoogloea sp.]|uniref:cupin n=1 Tax=Zoogloea sp. TaxID=49181 RepID=UPI002626148A|nr:cupin [Zoogloea sp.]MDD2988372.1 cupin [Zoogloea sp.]